MKENNFTKNVESLIQPVDVGTLHFIQGITGVLPLRVQQKLIKKTAKKTPYMGFVVEPYSFFFSHKIKDLEKAKSLLPNGYSLVKTKVFKDDKPEYYAIFGMFNVHTSGFWGLRLEFYIIAKNDKTGLTSWIIVDYDTNTISYDPKNGLTKPNAKKGIFTIDYDGIIHGDIKNNNDSQGFEFIADIKNGVMKELDEKLWIEGNLSICYGNKKAGKDNEPFSLIFDSKEFEKALAIPKEDVNIKLNNWYPGLFEVDYDHAICFPYAQHFISDSPGAYSEIKNEQELIQRKEELNFKEIKPFSASSIKKSMLIGMIITMIITTTLIILLIWKW